MNTINEELKKLAEHLYSEGYQCGISGDDSDGWFYAWAEAMRRVVSGQKYTDDLVLVCYNYVYEESLTALYNFVSGKSFPYTKGITTYKSSDINQRRLHNGLLELEKRGKVKRMHDEKDYVLWKPIE